MKRIVHILLPAMLLLVVLMPVLALADDAKTEETLSDLDGKSLYRTVCKVCHEEDSEAGWYTPMDLIQDQWEEFYDDLWLEAHEGLACPRDESKKVTDVIDADLLKKLRKFCVDHAADSEQPMTCG
jgi:hypothetical protein